MIRYAVLCPGQGAQHARMLDFGHSSSEGHEVIRAAARALSSDLAAWAADEASRFQNAHAQPLVCITQFAAWSVLKRHLPPPAAIAGYSVGELAAHAIGGGLAAGELALLAQGRARIMDEAAQRDPGGLMAVRGLRRDALVAACIAFEAYVAIAIDADSFVVGAPQNRLAELLDRLTGSGAQVTCLKVGVASHTPLLSGAVRPLRELLEQSSLNASAVPVIAGVDASVVTTRERAAETLAEQAAHTVEWSDCMDTLYERGCRAFLELPPGQALSRMMVARHPDTAARGVDEFASPLAVAAWLLLQLAV